MPSFKLQQTLQINTDILTGEKKPEHLVTADDVDSYLAVEVIPIGKEEQMVRLFFLLLLCYFYLVLLFILNSL